MLGASLVESLMVELMNVDTELDLALDENLMLGASLELLPSAEPELHPDPVSCWADLGVTTTPLRQTMT